MICKIHIRYKGISPLGKRNANCADCQQIRKIAEAEKQEKINSKNIYTSLTTPSIKVDLAHILAETMTIMKFGLQSMEFWKKQSSTDDQVKKFFFNCLKMSYSWTKNKLWAANSLKGLFHINFISKEIRESIEEIEVKTESKAHDNSIDFPSKEASDAATEFLNDNMKPKTINHFIKGSNG